MASVNARRVAVIIGVASLIGLTAWPPLSPASAQVPDIPPEADPMFEIISPVAHPMCGNAFLASTIAYGTLPPEAGQLGPVTALALLTVCGSVPTPLAEPRRCADDPVVTMLLDELGGATVGGALPVAVPSIGQIVDVLEQLEKHAEAIDVGASGTVGSTLQCQIATAAPRTQHATPSGTLGPFSLPPYTSGVPAVLGGNSPSPTITPGSVGPPLLGIAAPVAATRPAPRSVSYPIFLVPIAILIAAVVLARGLLAPATIESHDNP